MAPRAGVERRGAERARIAGRASWRICSALPRVSAASNSDLRLRSASGSCCTCARHVNNDQRVTHSALGDACSVRTRVQVCGARARVLPVRHLALLPALLEGIVNGLGLALAPGLGRLPHALFWHARRLLLVVAAARTCGGGAWPRRTRKMSQICSIFPHPRPARSVSNFEMHVLQFVVFLHVFVHGTRERPHPSGRVSPSHAWCPGAAALCLRPAASDGSARAAYPRVPRLAAGGGNALQMKTRTQIL